MGVLLAALFLLTPNAALADNECELVGVDPSANGSLADSYECPEASYGSGVTYTADGDLTVDFTNADSLARSTIGGSGVTLIGDGAESITFDSASTNTELQNQSGMTGPLLGVTTENGDIFIDTEEMDADVSSAASVTHAIYAESTGDGNIVINTTDDVTAGQFASSSNPDTSIGIEAITAGGNIDLTVSGGQVSGRQHAIRTETGVSGVATVTNTATNIVSGSTASAAIRATGGSLVLNNNGQIRGAMDFSGLAGGYAFNNNAGGIWRIDSASGSNLPDGAINNAGTIVFNRLNTLVSAPGTDFTGSGDSLLQDMDVFLGGSGRTKCANVGEVGDCFDLTGGSTAGETNVLVRGRFTTLVEGPLTTVTSANPGMVLIDVGGGASEADHFVLDPGSVLIQDDGAGSTTTPAYAEDPVYGAVLDTSVLGMGGIFDYALLYNPDTQQHLLASVPQSEAIEYVSFIRQAASIWHTATDTVVGRQAALRDGAAGKFWARYVNDSTDYDAAPSFSTQGNDFVYNQQYSLDTQSLIIGLDLISGDGRVFGVHGGLVESDSKFDDTGTSDEGKGVTAGLYGGWWHESGLSVDGAINLNSLTVDHTVSGSLESGDSDFRALGARLEAGWRLPLMEETLYVQPLATAAYVIADFDDVELRDNEISFEGTESSRAGLGARLGGTMDLTDSRYQRVAYWLTARAWEEFADEGEARFATRDGGHLSITDDRSGSFEEVDFGVELTNKEGNINVHFAGGVKFGDEIDSSSHFSIGARLNW